MGHSGSVKAPKIRRLKPLIAIKRRKTMICKSSNPAVCAFFSMLVLTVVITAVPAGADGMSGTIGEMMQKEMTDDSRKMMDSDTMTMKSGSMMAATVQMMDDSKDVMGDKPMMKGSDSMMGDTGQMMKDGGDKMLK